MPPYWVTRTPAASISVWSSEASACDSCPLPSTVTNAVGARRRARSSAASTCTGGSTTTGAGGPGVRDAAGGDRPATAPESGSDAEVSRATATGEAQAEPIQINAVRMSITASFAPQSKSPRAWREAPGLTNILPSAPVTRGVGCVAAGQVS